MGFPLSDDPLTITPQLMEQFLNSLKAADKQKQTIRTYRHSLEGLYEYLPPDKEILSDTLQEWKKHLKLHGYSDSTVNICITAANGFLRYFGREELTTVHERVLYDENMPEMTREEYLQFLLKVRELGYEKYYFIVKVFGSIDINIGELKCLTVETCHEGIIHLSEERTAVIPTCLQEELLRYAGRRGIMEGPIFVTRTGSLMDRSNITKSLHRLALRIGMDPEKCCPSALHRVYLRTQKELMDRIMPLFRQSYENLLNTEQAVVAWNK